MICKKWLNNKSSHYVIVHKLSINLLNFKKLGIFFCFSFGDTFPAQFQSPSFPKHDLAIIDGSIPFYVIPSTNSKMLSSTVNDTSRYIAFRHIEWHVFLLYQESGWLRVPWGNPRAYYKQKPIIRLAEEDSPVVFCLLNVFRYVTWQCFTGICRRLDLFIWKATGVSNCQYNSRRYIQNWSRMKLILSYSQDSRRQDSSLGFLLS